MATMTSARPEDLPQTLGLLERCGLPRDGLETSDTVIVVAKDDDRVWGCAALEVYGESGLLRSVAVDPAHRRETLGTHLVERMLRYAEQYGIKELYLLTETAAEYFSRFGFRPIAREAVSPAIHASLEWTSVCPASAQAMVVELPEASGNS
jgi:amino-acid N-acetyltransferase